MDPALIISGISAVLKAIDTWVKYKDSQRAANEFAGRLRQAQADPNVQQQGRTLANIVPQPILDSMGARVQKCWDNYNDVLKGGYLPGEIDDATRDVKACICRELRRLHSLNGSIPAGELSAWWSQYCAAK
jgi:hypothetical protein